MRVQVVEKPPRDLKIGLGYGTEDRFRAQLEWQHQNWLGGGRQLSLAGKYSFINVAGEAKFTQPHLFTPRTQGVVSLRQEREEEKTYRLDASRFNPRLEHRFSGDFSGFLGYRLEFYQFGNVSSTTVAALGAVEERGLLSGPSLGILWNTTDDPFNPKHGEILSLTVDQAGEIWGGKYSFYKITAEARKYLSLGWETVVAGRLKIGLADSIGPAKNYPLSERFFAGGEKSVRGFDRRELGPLSASNDPLGGLSLVEGSVELRRPLWGDLGGAVFLDFGQVSTRSFDPPFDDLKFAAGFGASYSTPVGPLRLDIAFPFDPRRGDRSWQIHFNIGASF